ncbi:protein FAM184A isoform X6 [Gossypium hirsutum]|uniref:Protein FAM184A isoform X6 n=1 Tax=Gossypium hirsutum TaxID=3635 RepID=A0ABM3BL31_GOSHI|nr:protein FAM184A-like isoform X6 [Gossypium hirsutum]
MPNSGFRGILFNRKIDTPERRKTPQKEISHEEEKDMEIEDESRDEKDIDVCSEDGPEEPSEEIIVHFEDQHQHKGEDAASSKDILGDKKGMAITGPEEKCNEESKSMTTGLEKKRDEEQKDTTTSLEGKRNEERKSTATGSEEKRNQELKSTTTSLEEKRNEESKRTRPEESKSKRSPFKEKHEDPMKDSKKKLHEESKETTTGLEEKRNDEQKGSEEKRNEEQKVTATDSKKKLNEESKETTTGLEEKRNEEQKGPEEKPKEESKGTTSGSKEKRNDEPKDATASSEDKRNKKLKGRTTLWDKFKDAMEGKSDVGNKTLTRWRELPPRHYIVKIKSFWSLIKSLEKNKLKNYKSDEFEASGFTWHLLLYLSVEKESPHVSLGLEFVSSKKLDEEIKAVVIFFLHDQLNNRYLSIQDTDVKRFNGKNKELKLSQIVPPGCFENPLNGYLVKDECAFGVEVFVLKDESKTRASFRTLMKESKKVYTWNVNRLFLLETTRGVYSKPFTFRSNLEEVYKWRLHLYKGIDEMNNRYMSISLCLLQKGNQTEFPLGWKMHLEFKLSLTNRDVKKLSRSGKALFSVEDKAWGFPKFIELEGLRGCDDMKIEVEFIKMSMEIIDQKAKAMAKAKEESSP